MVIGINNVIVNIDCMSKKNGKTWQTKLNNNNVIMIIDDMNY